MYEPEYEVDFDVDCPWYGEDGLGCLGKCKCFTNAAVLTEDFVSWKNFDGKPDLSYLEAVRAEDEAYWLSLLGDPQGLVPNDEDLTVSAVFE